MQERTKRILEDANDRAEKTSGGSTSPMGAHEVGVRVYRATSPDIPIYLILHRDDLASLWWKQTKAILKVIKTEILENGSSET